MLSAKANELYEKLINRMDAKIKDAAIFVFIVIDDTPSSIIKVQFCMLATNKFIVSFESIGLGFIYLPQLGE